MRKIAILFVIAAFSVTTALHSAFHPPQKDAKYELVSKNIQLGQAAEITAPEAFIPEQVSAPVLEAIPAVQPAAPRNVLITSLHYKPPLLLRPERTVDSWRSKQACGLTGNFTKELLPDKSKVPRF